MAGMFSTLSPTAAGCGSCVSDEAGLFSTFATTASGCGSCVSDEACLFSTFATTGSGEADEGYGSFSAEASAAIEQATSMTPSTIWMPDEAVHDCFKCNIPFTFLRRRHHCRACGRIFCAECAPRTRNQYKRLCMDCADEFGLVSLSVRAELQKQASPTQARALGPSSSQAGPSGEPPLIVKNTFVACPRSESTERHFRRPTSSFPL